MKHPVSMGMWLAVFSLLVAACNGPAAAPTFTPGPTASPAPTATPLGTEDPDEGLIFDTLTITRSGGIAGTTTIVTVLGNGALLSDGALVGSVGQDVVLALDRQLDTMGFLRLDPFYGPPSSPPDAFVYDIEMTRHNAEATVRTVDGSVPDSLRELIATVLALTPTGPAPDPTVEALTNEDEPLPQ